MTGRLGARRQGVLVLRRREGEREREREGEREGGREGGREEDKDGTHDFNNIETVN